MSMDDAFYAYWGKASPNTPDGPAFHLLPYHSLDVAACGQVLVALPSFSLQPLADDLGWPVAQVESLFVFFLALHDLGKFARAFQGLVPDLPPEFVQPDPSKRYGKRHDTLGWLLWNEDLAGSDELEALPAAIDDFWGVWVRCMVGHHGKPPEEVDGGGLVPLLLSDFFLRADRRAAGAFTAELTSWMLPEGLPAPRAGQEKILRRHGWRLAGLGVLADWLGSNQVYFPYQTVREPLQSYWRKACTQAQEAVNSAGLQAAPLRPWAKPLELFDYLAEPTPLQQYAATVALKSGPQLFLLEDVTGAGKTEAALLLAQRLMQAGHAQGLYFALPSMATANQMYQRVGGVYRRLYQPDSTPSLILSHGARQLVDGFRDSVLPASPADDCRYVRGEGSATVQCNAWLADNRKKALLAEVGVGTLDQALLAVLPARHQSLRLLGLAGKVLLIDEVHAYDHYMMVLLQTLLRAHARQGGSVILLSATLPLALRTDLLAAYQGGLGVAEPEILDDARYPLAVCAGQTLSSHACQTRPQVRRRVSVQALNDEAQAVALLVEQARGGRCLCWIRNTVDDARRAHQMLTEQLPAGQVTLFHSRYAMGDRLTIESDVLGRFGKHSAGADRAGRILIGTQVLEQSLDFDVDVMISDLAPIDLLIQRAGRLQRHARTASGDPAENGLEQRPAPVFHVLMPPVDDSPSADWYAALFPKACFVYPDIGKLWLGARALLRAGCIQTPGEPGEAGSVRALVESVYGSAVEPIPEALQRATREQIGKDLAMRSQAHFNALRLDRGYCCDSSYRWYEDNVVPTRLGDEIRTLYLAIWQSDELQPICADGAHPWEQSAVRVGAYLADTLEPEWELRFAPALAQLRSRYRLLEGDAFILPMMADGDRWRGQVLDERGRLREMVYDCEAGLCW